MAGLPDIQNQTKALPDNVAAVYQGFATGTGPNGSIVIGDVLGAAVGYGYTSQMASVTVAINNLYTAGSLTNLINTYVAMLSTVDDPAMQTLIAQANSQISIIAAANAGTVSTINSLWSAMATKLNTEYNFQSQADIEWADITPNSRTSITALIVGLPNYGLDVDTGGPSWFIDQIANVSTQGGQAIIGTLRESRNNQRLSASQLKLDTTPSVDPAITPVPIVTPVN